MTSHQAVVAASTRPATAATPNAANAAAFTEPGVGEPGADQPHRADPVGVGAADAVGVVVGVVDADLQREPHHESEQRLPPDRVAVVRRHAVPASTGATAAGKVRGRAPATHSAGVVTTADSSRLRRAVRPGRCSEAGAAVARRARDARGLAFAAWICGPAPTPRRPWRRTAWLAGRDTEPVVVETSGSRERPSGWCFAGAPCWRRRARRPRRLGGAGRGCSPCRVVRRRVAGGPGRWSPATGRCCSTTTRAGRAVAAAGGAPTSPWSRPSCTGARVARRHGGAAGCTAVLLGGGPVDRALRIARAEAGIRVGGDVRLGRDRRRLRLRRAAARRRGGGDRRRRPDPDRRTDALRRVRRRPRADGRGAGGRVVPDRGRAVGSTRTAGCRCSAGSTTW